MSAEISENISESLCFWRPPITETYLFGPKTYLIRKEREAKRLNLQSRAPLFTISVHCRSEFSKKTQYPLLRLKNQNFERTSDNSHSNTTRLNKKSLSLSRNLLSVLTC